MHNCTVYLFVELRNNHIKDTVLERFCMEYKKYVLYIINSLTDIIILQHNQHFYVTVTNADFLAIFGTNTDLNIIVIVLINIKTSRFDMIMNSQHKKSMSAIFFNFLYYIIFADNISKIHSSVVFLKRVQ